MKHQATTRPAARELIRDDSFRLVMETAIDHAAVRREQAEQERRRIEFEKRQLDMFGGGLFA